jgi:hypothetical protein
VCDLCARFRAGGVFIARKAGQLISRGSRTWIIRISLGRDPETGTRKYHNKTIRGSFREAQTYLSGKLQEREIGRLPRAAAISLNQYVDQWLMTAAEPRLRPKSYIDYEALLRLHIRPVFGTMPLGAIVQFDIQSIYAQMFERGFQRAGFHVSAGPPPYMGFTMLRLQFRTPSWPSPRRPFLDKSDGS